MFFLSFFLLLFLFLSRVSFLLFHVFTRQFFAIFSASFVFSYFRNFFLFSTHSFSLYFLSSFISILSLFPSFVYLFVPNSLKFHSLLSRSLPFSILYFIFHTSFFPPPFMYLFSLYSFPLPFSAPISNQKQHRNQTTLDATTSKPFSAPTNRPFSFIHLGTTTPLCPAKWTGAWRCDGRDR